MKIRPWVTLFLFALFGLGVMNAQTSSISFDIKNWDGSDKNIELNSLKKITFGNGNMILTYQAGNVENVATSTIKKLIFGSITGVNEVRNSGMGLQVYPNPGNDFIALKNVSGNLVIYSICGNQLINRPHYTNNEKVDISGLTQGIYIIKINHQAVKFSKL